MKKTSMIAIILSVILLLSACGGTQSTSEVSSISSVPLDSSASSADQSSIEEAEPFAVITDHADREVIITEKPEKIVSGYYITSSVLIGLGVDDLVVGIENKADTRPIYSLAAPHLLDVPGVGTSKEFNIEATLELEPDLVILPLKLSEVADTLAEFGIPTLCVYPESNDLLVETIEMLATATGTQDKMDAMLSASNDALTMLDETLNDKPAPTVYFGGNSDLLSTAGANMYQNDLITAANAQNVAADIEDTYWAEISYEQLIAYNPEYIIIAPAAEYTAEDVLNDAALQELDCIKEGNVYQMPSSLEAWDSPLPSSYLGSLWLASVLHSDVYTNDEFVSQTVDFYQQFYDFSVDTTLLTPTK